jgi:hypothetical protein
MTRPAVREESLDGAEGVGTPDAEAIGARTWAALLGLALALRVGWALMVPIVPVSDSHAYDVFARNLALHAVYGWEPGVPSAYWPVGTSFLYSMLYRVFGLGYGPIAALNVACGVGIVGLTTLLTNRWFGRRPAVLAGALVACWPSLVQFTTVLASELPFMVLVLAAMAMWLRDGRTPGQAAWTGVLLAGACYIRPTALLLPAVFAVLSLLRGERLSRTAAGTAVAVAATLALLAPWSLRNTLLFDRFVLVSTNGGTNTWMGNNPASNGEYMELPPSVERLGEAERDAYLAAEAKRYILQYPVRFAARTAVKLVRLHERESIGISWNVQGLERRLPHRTVMALKIASNVYWWVLLGLALAGVAVLARRIGWHAALHPAVVTWGYLAAVHATTVVQDRYHLPSNPFIAALAGVALASALRPRRGSEATART